MVTAGPRWGGAELPEASLSRAVCHTFSRPLWPQWSLWFAQPWGCSAGQTPGLVSCDFFSIGGAAELHAWLGGGYSPMLGNQPPCHSSTVAGWDLATPASHGAPLHPGQAHTALLLASMERPGGQTQLLKRKGSPHDIPHLHQGRSGDSFPSIPTPGPSRAAETKDAPFWGPAKMAALPVGWALGKRLGCSLGSSQASPADKCVVPRRGGERPLETHFAKAGLIKMLSVSPFPLAVTLFELTVVNNWYIIMVRTSVSSWGHLSTIL